MDLEPVRRSLAEAEVAALERSPAQILRQRTALVERAARVQTRRHDVQRWGLVAMAALVLAVVGASTWLRSDPVGTDAPPAVASSSTTPSAGQTPGTAPAPTAPATVSSQAPERTVVSGQGKRIAFADGSHIAWQARATGQVDRSVAGQVDVQLDHGRVDVEVEPRANTTWTIRAGQYRVHVVGTVFYVERNGDDIEVGVSRGKVRVEGDGEPVLLGAGEHITGGADGLHRDPPAAIEPEPRVRSRTASKRRGPSWRDLHRSGDHTAALQEADRLGYDKLVGTLPVEDLSALADVARLARAPGKADVTLRAIRRRFAGTRQATRAAFLLGRLKTRSAPTQAADLFRAYLREAPKGPYAAEARGRLMETLERAGKAKAAQSAAKTYLDRHPKGPYAARARALLATP